MQLTVWTYEGPPHVGAIRIATAMQGVHYVLHAPQGDTYADLLFTMIERRAQRPAVSYTTFQARDLGGDTAELFKRSAREAFERFRPDVLLVGASCTGELIQDDPGGLAEALGLPVPVIALDLPAYQRKENWGAAETFYRMVRTFAARARRPQHTPQRPGAQGGRFSCNLLGATSLGFRHRDDLLEVKRLLASYAIDINVVAPYDATVADLARLPDADFNVVMYAETAGLAASWLEREWGQPSIKVAPIGVLGVRAFVDEIARITAQTLAQVDDPQAHSSWYTRSVDANYLTHKRVFVFGDATHAVAAARVAQDEMGFQVVGLGTYSRELAREVRDAAKAFELTPLITDDYLEVESAITALMPDLVLGTQMERHIAKRLGIPCAVISAPVHVQDFPARYAPQMGLEGANVLFDTWVHPLMMGLEEHLLHMFKDDFEFHADATPSHLGSAPVAAARVASTAATQQLLWLDEAEQELSKIPFFVRGKARRNTERFARDRGVAQITLETLYDAKAHFSS